MPHRREKLRIVHVTAEVDPFFRSGGLGVVTQALPRAQTELGQDVTVIAPYYKKLIPREVAKAFSLVRVGSAEIDLSHGRRQAVEPVTFWRGTYDNGTVIYFVSHKTFFDDRKKLYGGARDSARFALFNFAVVALMRQQGIRPDVLQCHDWHAGLVPYLLRTKYSREGTWAKTAIVFTIHNLTYQLGKDWSAIPPAQRDDGHAALPYFRSAAFNRINFAKRGILYADAVNTVSETYREEILTADFGEDLNRILKNRRKRVFGIVNGIDYEAYNPLTDPGIQQHYSDKSIERKAANKAWLQKHYGFPVDAAIPVLCMTSRIVEQKGFRLLMRIMEAVLRHGAQCVIMGDGDKVFVEFFTKIARKNPSSFVITPYDATYETSLYAGADIFLLPSRFEPCGINQMIALRYGCVPVVHHIGGLADTVEDFDPRKGTGNGFTFDRYGSQDLLIAVTRALYGFRYRGPWKKLMRRGMREANSWRIPAQKYMDLYRTALRLRKRNA